ncbi:DUF4190 domain-containing protein [Kitasatospora sp. NPDC096147]|uniref:DUF4190 domain-containing protein n=1 Tax=Kitasatospora sp. NPDC096147 TaxID=3364093 RepID=UPI0037FB2180
MSNPYQQPPPDPYAGYGQQQPYPAPPYPQAPYQQPGFTPAPEPNTLAKAALALGFASIIVCVYGSVLGLVGVPLGIAGLNKARQTGLGRTQAIGGIVLSALGVLIGIAVLVLAETAPESFWQQ